MKTSFIIDLCSGETESLPQEEVVLATKGLRKVETQDAVTYVGEEYMVVLIK